MFFFTTPATFGFLLEFLEIVFLGIAFLEKIAPITLAFCRLFPEFLVIKADGWVWAGIQRMYRRHIVFISQQKLIVKQSAPTLLFQAYFPT